MVYFDVLPAAQLSSFLVAPPPPPPPPPPPAAAPVVKIVKVIPRQFDAGRLIAPKAVPKNIAMITEEELPPSTGTGVIGGVPGGVAGGSLTGVLGGIVGSAAGAAPPPPPPPKAVVPQRIRVGGNVQAANLINQIRPIYPPLAKQARISGVVELSAIIGKDGRVQDLKVIKGHPLLVQAALDAVKGWVYRPTLLNGEPVEVSTTIDVNFTLSQ
jgi:protein TonB